jgi:hypothetical protein
MIEELPEANEFHEVYAFLDSPTFERSYSK